MKLKERDKSILEYDQERERERGGGNGISCYIALTETENKPNSL